jgi:hypothetical protein
MKIKNIDKNVFKKVDRGVWERVSKDGKIYLFREKICDMCHENFLPWRKSAKYCSDKCRSEYFSGENGATWKGGKTTNKQGYVMVLKKEHPHAVAPNFRISEHRLQMEKKLGRYLKKEEHVHHLNGIKNDNRIENLVLITKSEHSSIHMEERWKNPKFSKIARKAVRNKWKDPSFRSRMSRSSRLCLSEQWKNQAFKSMQPKKASLQWKDPNFRANHAKKLRLKWNDPVFRAKMSKKNRLSALASWKRRKENSQFNLS